MPLHPRGRFLHDRAGFLNPTRAGNPHQVLEQRLALCDLRRIAGNVGRGSSLAALRIANPVRSRIHPLALVIDNSVVSSAPSSPTPSHVLKSGLRGVQALATEHATVILALNHLLDPFRVNSPALRIVLANFAAAGILPNGSALDQLEAEHVRFLR